MYTYWVTHTRKTTSHRNIALSKTYINTQYVLSNKIWFLHLTLTSYTGFAKFQILWVVYLMSHRSNNFYQNECNQCRPKSGGMCVPCDHGLQCLLMQSVCYKIFNKSDNWFGLYWTIDINTLKQSGRLFRPWPYCTDVQDTW
jgi:hypothetical protein